MILQNDKQLYVYSFFMIDNFTQLFYLAYYNTYAIVKINNILL